MQSYTLDLRTLLQILARQKQNGVLYAEIVRIPDIKKPGEVHLDIIEGNVHSCIIHLKTGGVFAENSQALQIVSELGTLEWRWTASTTQKVTPWVVSPSSQEDSSTLIPQRTTSVEAMALHMLPHNHRRVLILVDGIRTISKISSMLSLTDYRELFNVLHEMQAKGMITFSKTPLDGSR